MSCPHKKCYIVTCTTRKPDRSFHQFPSNYEMRKKWLKCLHLPSNISIPDTATICSLHFDNSAYRINTLKKKRLLQNAVPTLCLAGIQQYNQDHRKGINNYVRLKIKECILFNCNNNSLKRPDLSFYHFPKSEIYLQKWIEKMPYLSGQICNNYVLCSQHFEDSDFDIMDKRKLNQKAVPRIFKNEQDEKINISGPVIQDPIPVATNTIIKSEQVYDNFTDIKNNFITEQVTVHDFNDGEFITRTKEFCYVVTEF